MIVTHNMAQARRASDECIFMLLGEIIEHTRTEDLFLNPQNPKTAEYIEGRYASDRPLHGYSPGQSASAETNRVHENS